MQTRLPVKCRYPPETQKLRMVTEGKINFPTASSNGGNLWGFKTEYQKLNL